MRRQIGFVIVLGLVCGGVFRIAAAAEPKQLRGKWETAFQAKRVAGIRPLPEKSLVKSLTELDLQGAIIDPNHLGPFAINGDFGLNDGALAPIAGINTGVELVPELDQFELEANILAEGLGGWFWLVGWRDGHGYVIYNVTLKKSGSPWLLGEFRGGVGVAETFREFNRLEWKGPQPLRLSVIEGKLNLSVGDARLARDVELPNYHPGAIVMGTYNTQYGPRPVRVQSVRTRTVELKAP
jgi:hypothetical protein